MNPRTVVMVSMLMAAGLLAAPAALGLPGLLAGEAQAAHVRLGCSSSSSSSTTNYGNGNNHTSSQSTSNCIVDVST